METAYFILLIGTRVSVSDLIGNPVEIGDGPAAVIGDENRNSH